MSGGFRPRLAGLGDGLKRKLGEPMLVAGAVATGAILLADRGVYHPLSAIAAIVLGIGFFLQSRKRTFLLLALAGTFAFAHDQRLRHMLELPFAEEIAGGERLLVEAEGVIDSIPKATSDERGDRVSFFLSLKQIRRIGGEEVPADQRIFVNATLDPPPGYGDRVRLTGRLYQPDPPRNPGGFDFGRFLRRKGVVAQLATHRGTGIEVLGSGHGNPIIASADRARRWVAGTITRDLARRDPEIAGVLTAMTLGSRSDARDELIDSFRTSGTLHIFAVSGLHVGLIAIILWHLLSPLPVSRRKRAVCIILILCCYAFVTGLRPSAVRATVMAGLVLAAPAINREPRLINSLGTAAIVILAFDSNQLFLPGFQLSFSVLLALTLLRKPILHLLTPLASHDPFIPTSLLTDSQRGFYRSTRALAETFAVSAAAWIGSLPLMLYHFKLVTPIAPIANLFLIPVAFCILGTAILSTLVGAIGSAAVCAILNNANFLFASILTAAAAFFSNLPVPASHFYAGRPAALRPACEITVLDLPRGGASALIATERRADWLIDTGNSREFRRTVNSSLQQHGGVTRLDAILLTHADAGHIGASPEVIETFRPKAIYPPTPNNSSASYRRLEEILAERGEEPQVLREGQTLNIDRHHEIKILFRPENSKPRLSDDACMVFLLKSHGWRILFTGDAGFTTEQTLLQTHPDELRADVIIRGHHNADHSATPGFIAAVQPSAVVINARHFENESPAGDIWKHPATTSGIQIFDQAETGAVTIEIEPERLEIRSFLTDQSLILKRAR